MSMRNRKFAWQALWMCLVWMAAAPLAAEDDRLFWFTRDPEALQEARRTGKPIFLEFRCEA